MTIQLTDTWKEGLARIVRRRPLAGLMNWGVRLVVPRQRVGVALVTFNDDEEILLLRHVFHAPNPWGLPGGWLGRNEAPQAGLIRELREETGLAVVLDRPVHVAHAGAPPYIVMAYSGRLQPGEMRLNAEILEARWFGLDRLPGPLTPFADAAITAGLSLHRLAAQPHRNLLREAS